MDVIFHAHHAVVTDRLRERAERSVERLASRLRRTVDAVVRFEEDGRTRRVEIVVHAPRHCRLVAEGQGRVFGAALADAISRLESQVLHRKRTPRSRARAAQLSSLTTSRA
jgi:ribosome-associated translation inhibitor RaiA